MNRLSALNESFKTQRFRTTGMVFGAWVIAALAACKGTIDSHAPGENDIEGCSVWNVDQFAPFSSIRLDCQHTRGLEEAKQYDRIAEIRIESGAETTYLNLNGFDDLTKLAIRNDHLVTLDLSENLALETLHLNAEVLTEVTLPAVELKELTLNNTLALSHLDLSGVQVKSLELFGELGFDPTGLLSREDIRNLMIGSPSVSSLDLSRLPSLEILHLRNAALLDLPVADHPSLREVFISGGSLTTLDLSQTSIASVILSGTSIADLSLPEGRNFERLEFREHQSQALRIDGGGSFDEFRMAESLTVDLDISTLRSLSFLALTESQVQGLDLSNNDRLEGLYIKDTPVENLILPNTAHLEILQLRGTRLACAEAADLIAGLNDETAVTVDDHCDG